MYQPRSVRRFGFVFFALLAALLISIVELTSHGAWP
jgi:hypothetical protein